MWHGSKAAAAATAMCMLPQSKPLIMIGDLCICVCLFQHSLRLIFLQITPPPTPNIIIPAYIFFNKFFLLDFFKPLPPSPQSPPPPSLPEMTFIQNSTSTFRLCSDRQPRLQLFTREQFLAIARHGICTEYAPARFHAIVMRIPRHPPSG